MSGEQDSFYGTDTPEWNRARALFAALPDDSPTCTLDGVTLDYDNVEAIWFCPEPGCEYTVLDSYEH